MVDDRENLDPEDKKEDSFEFDSAGEAAGYISMAQARVRAMRTARDEPGNYGVDFVGVPMVFEVEDAKQDSHDDGGLFHIKLSYRPEGNFQGQSGIEEFILTDVGEMEIRQVLSWPVGTSQSVSSKQTPSTADVDTHAVAMVEPGTIELEAVQADKPVNVLSEEESPVPIHGSDPQVDAKDTSERGMLTGIRSAAMKVLSVIGSVLLVLFIIVKVAQLAGWFMD